ncbi:MAG: hypothetical protein G3M70_11770 [Candidatus Nitronauta litoralis]|uniref:Uncharacterized protein n=1 Tax=Candidatus Nitronauta litoralis TaxID=2705533 RepID=A0A7T0G0G6_9BACT|nr:MAG: hypothetical protein G3M70_11770 [Candidatus Nitronauta litoralis]
MMPRLNLEDARAVGAAVEYALSTLPQNAPQRPNWERAFDRLHLRLKLAEQGIRHQRRKHSKLGPAND